MADSVTDPELRGRLNQAKLRSVVRAHTGATEVVDRPLGALAAVLTNGDGWVLVDGSTNAGLGAALAWARRSSLEGHLNVVADGTANGAAAPGVLARRAGYFVDSPTVYRLDGTQLQRAEPAAHLPVLAASPEALAAASMLREAGAEIVVEHGVVMAEINGLEVGRVVANAEDDGVHLEVGVGRYDREAAQIMQQIRTPDEVRDAVLTVVRSHRAAGQPPHLLTRLARQRWLRARLLEDATPVGASELRPLEPPVERENLIDPMPAFAVGRGLDGTAIVVACAVGVDAEAMVHAADGRDRVDPDAELVYVCPGRDQYPLIVELAAALRRPARLVALDGEWVT